MKLDDIAKFNEAGLPVILLIKVSNEALKSPTTTVPHPSIVLILVSRQSVQVCKVVLIAASNPFSPNIEAEVAYSPPVNCVFKEKKSPHVARAAISLLNPPVFELTDTTTADKAFNLPYV